MIAKDGQLWATVAAILLAFIALCSISFDAHSWGSYPAARREVKAGYTTILLPHQPELDLVDPETGIVVRAAGEKALTEDEYEAAVIAVRGG